MESYLDLTRLTLGLGNDGKIEEVLLYVPNWPDHQSQQNGFCNWLSDLQFFSSAEI